MTEVRGETRFPTVALRDHIAFFTDVLGMRMDMVFLADDPAVAVVSGYGLPVRIAAGVGESPGPLRILTEDPDGFAGGQRVLRAPNGTRIEIDHLAPPFFSPETDHRFFSCLTWPTRPSGSSGARACSAAIWSLIVWAGRSLPVISGWRPGACNGAAPYGGVSADLLFLWLGGSCLRKPRRSLSGDGRGLCFQPPEIRYQVLYASTDIDVIEIGVPTEHVTTIDHQMALPNGPARPRRRVQGQHLSIARRAGPDMTATSCSPL